MVYEVHGNVASGNVQKVLVVLAQLDLLDDEHFKLLPISDFTEMHTEEWLAHQPFAQMPWFRDTETGVEMYESRAIGRYLAQKHKSSLIVSPDAGMAKWIAWEQAASAELADLDSHLSPIAKEMVTQPKLMGSPGNQQVIDYHRTDLDDRLKAYDRILAKQRYLAGDELTLLDLFPLPLGVRSSIAGGAPGLTDGSLPNVARWWKEITSLPAWAKVLEMIVKDPVGKMLNQKSKL